MEDSNLRRRLVKFASTTASTCCSPTSGTSTARQKTIRDFETTFLKAFYAYAKSNNRRLTQLEDNQAAIRSRLGTLEGRVTETERRLN